MIIGHKQIEMLFLKSIDNNNLSHAHLIVGEDGIGKSVLATEIAMKILGKSRKVDYADIINYRAKGKSFGVDEVRSIIQEVGKKPFEGSKKVIIIHNLELMTESAQNALLKTIEEPPNGVYIFLLCENLNKILDTIKSRTMIYRLNRLCKEDMIAYLNKDYSDISDDDIEKVLTFSEGVPGRAEKILKDDSFNEMRNLVSQIMVDISEANREACFKFAENLIKYKDNWRELLTVFSSIIRDVLVYTETLENNDIINIDKIEEIKKLSEIYSYNKLDRILSIISYVRENLESNVNTEAVLEIMMIKMREV